MELKVIAFSMTAILITLFVASYFLAPKEKEKMKLEARYTELLLSLKDNVTGENDDLILLGRKLGKSKEQVESDLKTIQS